MIKVALKLKAAVYQQNPVFYKTLQQCFALDAFCSEAIHSRGVLRLDFIDKLQL